ncbi:haloacid dehalogenase-like hydrolase domain-containing 5 isoform X2 [Neopsephotus bourkii]|uniref:haloacid dehalogenase-like hydrolase domain-containing 5 isoform X2 n=1 Tax=Neopsephotus bourkii TaxID=309878 RepID=UPI002AA51910|nr:haloacid dehalogenase-like hydrolase domain-containing 5 isoform X2 [Neopsephotus bourkii]
MYSSLSNSFLQLSVLPSFGFLFDIDGVLVRGKTPIPAAKTAFQKLVNSQGQFMVPVVFVTNAGNCLRQEKADQLSQLLGVPISQDQVVMSHSPLRMFKRYHDKCVLVSGQGPLLDIAQDLGFCQPITIETLREKHPLLDVVDHDRRPNALSPSAVELPKIEAVVLFGEPVRWETNLQLIIDVLLTSGYPGNPYHHENYPHIPVLACNMDLMWVAEAQSPRDNLMTDVYGANLYNRYLEENSRQGSKSWVQAKAAGGRGPTALSQDEEIDNSWENELASAAAAHCRSVLVCTGVYNPHTEVPLDTRVSIAEMVFHGHRDFRFEPGLVEPDHIVPDIDAAVDLVFQLENFAPY